MDCRFIMIVDDNKSVCDQVKNALVISGYQTQCCHEGNSAIRLLYQHEPDVLLIDTGISDPSAMAVLAEAKLLYPQLPVIIITAHPDIVDAICAIKAGAWDYFPKPFEINHLMELVSRAMKTRWCKNSSTQTNENTRSRIRALMGNSVEIENIIKDILRVAHTDFSVIVESETGTGKELIAKNIHLASLRENNIFIPIDCGAIADSLIENELFGHEKGAYTGANNVQIGKFEAAEGGTLFLDEITNMSLAAQAKLLRALQERVIYRIGGNQPIPVNVRVIAASNENLLESVVKGKFRQDLYYRLNEYSINIPPLRTRPEDILFLAERFMQETRSELLKPPVVFSDAAKDRLLEHSWPGNVRELRAVIRRAALVVDQEVQIDDLGLSKFGLISTRNDFQLCLEGASLKEITQINIDMVERIVIEKMLRETHNNKAETARRLDIDYKTLYYKLKKISCGENSYE